jgi:pyruvate carboxylase
MFMVRKITKLLAANRGEIAIRILRAASDLGITTVAIYSKEDENSLHRFKADESYLVGEGKKPIDAYLDIEGIIEIAKDTGCDAIHPGYGFLSENLHFAQRCEDENILFVGPEVRHLDMFGDKVKAKEQALLAGIPTIPGSDGPVKSADEVTMFGAMYGYPMIIKAANGGGGRGMRIVRNADEVEDAFNRASSEAKASFGNDEVYCERYVENPKHIEVQILADKHGNLVHLFERDCSVQRRYQKVVEVAPCHSITEEMRLRICDAAVQLMKNVGYVNAGTVEFLASGDEFFFIEVNPRVQVEHTITEMVTGVDIVQSQIKVAEGYQLHSEEINVPLQKDIKINGFAIQCRITTEDPTNHFMPDTGKITAYRSSGGFGVRLDGCNGFAGSEISPFYDSLLVKVSVWGMTFEQTAQKMNRTLQEFRIRGVKTNIKFLENVVMHKDFISGNYNTSFLEKANELFQTLKDNDPGSKYLQYIGNVTVNGFPGIGIVEKPDFGKVRIPIVEKVDIPFQGTKQILDEQGPEGVVNWIKQQEKVLITDTTFRDAHQSLLATRVRTKDMLAIAEQTSQMLPNLFSMEMWGGATFDVAYRFLKEDPWERLRELRKLIPNHMFQMLLRGSNAVGYTNYPDNVIREFVKHSAESGVDVFRIFDSLNWIKNMEVAIDATRQAGKIAEATICYTADILDPSRPKYTVDYYKKMARELEAVGAHILCIKDMAGLIKPEAAYRLISELKATVDIPIHLHTHDTSGNGIMMYSKAIDAGVDIIDTALGAMSGMTSQPSMNSLYYAMAGHERQPEINIKDAEKLSYYWEDVRKYYSAFESGMMAPHSEIYVHEMPGGQYSNLQQQAIGVGLGERFEEVKEMYGTVNQMFGDIVKVTPSSKVVGDMALFMVQNNLTEEKVMASKGEISFPDSVVDMMIGNLGQPEGGWPADLQQIILNGRDYFTCRPGEKSPSVDFEAKQAELEALIGRKASKDDLMGYLMYPKVFKEYVDIQNLFGDVSLIDTPTYHHGMRLGERVSIELYKGKRVEIKLESISHAGDDGFRTLYFVLNGQTREVRIKDESIKSTVVTKLKAEAGNPKHIGASMPGVVLKVMVEAGQKVAKGQHLMVTEAMKMETTVQAPFEGVVDQVYMANGEAIQPGDLLISFAK